MSKSMLDADTAPAAAAAALLAVAAVPWLEFQSLPATILRSRIVQTAGNQKLIPMLQSCCPCTARDVGPERTTRHALRQSVLCVESQRPSATTAASLTTKPGRSHCTPHRFVLFENVAYRRTAPSAVHCTWPTCMRGSGSRRNAGEVLDAGTLPTCCSLYELTSCSLR